MDLRNRSHIIEASRLVVGSEVWYSNVDGVWKVTVLDDQDSFFADVSDIRSLNHQIGQKVRPSEATNKTILGRSKLK